MPGYLTHLGYKVRYVRNITDVGHLVDEVAGEGEDRIAKKARMEKLEPMEIVQRYTFGKIYNSEAFAACTNMPRFGHKGILSEQQIKDVTALLLDPASPVNQ